MLVGHFKRVNSFEHLLKRLLTEANVWDNVHVDTDMEMLMPPTFHDGEIQYNVYVMVYYTDTFGRETATNFYLSTTLYDLALEMEEKSRSIIPKIFE